MSPKTLNPLANIAALGFLDLSATDVTLKTLQICLRPVQIMRLHLFNCPKIECLVAQKHENASDTELIFGSKKVFIDGLQVSGVSVDAAAVLNVTTSQNLRKFLVFVMPNVWSYNGIPILQNEWNKARNYFEAGGKGQFLDLMRKHYVDIDSRFISRIKKQNPEASSSAIKAEYESLECKKIWTSCAKKVMAEMPQSFTMSVDKDAYRLKHLAADLEYRVAQLHVLTVFAFDQIRGSVAAFLNIAHTYSPQVDKSKLITAYEFEARVTLALLIFASLIDGIPIIYSQAALESIFEANEINNGIRKVHWAQRPVSPLLWRIQERLEYLGLLVAMIEQDLHDCYMATAYSSNFPHGSAHDIWSRIDSFRPIIQHLHEHLYQYQISRHKSSNHQYFSYEDFEVQEPLTQLTPIGRSNTLHPSTATLINYENLKTQSIESKIALLELEILPFLMCHTLTIPAIDVMQFFPMIQHTVQWIANIVLKIHDSRKDASYERILELYAIEGGSRGRSVSRSRIGSVKKISSTNFCARIHKQVTEIAKNGVISAEEINEWTESVYNTQLDHEHNSIHEKDFENSLDGLVFYIKLKVLEAVDLIIELAYDKTTDETGLDKNSVATATSFTDKNAAEDFRNTKIAENTEIETDNDGEIQIFELLRGLRIQRHPRDPVPSSLTLKGIKIIDK
ncbi:hypothetical protein HK100_004100 [Physocladia obscura]|uniref:Uncharacterized protein n=1 Tax=Physocladia obscura TaxID=109957 RepID=A0AAD5ST78_9FUNG|nr:hypothetical protein HK100_004100 [Physocladia obscura]